MIEREVENLLESLLREQDWIVDVGNYGRQVYRQCPRTQEEKNKLKKISGFQKFPDFILYENDDTSTPIAIIETKSSTYTTLEEAQEQAFKYAIALDAKFIFLYNSCRFISYWTKNKQNLFINDEEVIDILPLKILKQFRGNKLYFNNRAEIKSKSDLLNIFKYANNKLREAGISVGITRFTEFSNLLFLKLVSELNEEKNFNISEELLWNSYHELEGKKLLSYINNTVIPQLNTRFDMDQSDPLFSKLKIKNTFKLKEIINKLDTVDLQKIDTDIKGEAFEYFIQKYNQTNNDLGEYFTPRHIVRFIVELINPKFGEKIYDPFCGTGGMLIVAFKKIQEELIAKGILNDDNLTILRENTLWGSEISDTSRVAKMNMILFGDGHTNINHQDSFLHPVENKYNIVLSNIPFNLDVTETQAELYYPFIQKGNAVSLLHIIKSLNKETIKSRAAIIVPDAVLNDRSMIELRKILIKQGLLTGIISLPSNVFLPYTEAKTSILLLNNFSKLSPKHIFIYKVKNDGFTLTTRRRPINGINDLDKFIFLHNDMVKNYNKKYTYKNLFYVNKDDILKNSNCSLLLSQYYDDEIKGFIRLNKILKKEKIQNINRYSTASIVNSSFWGMVLGEEYWDDSFVSVTSADNIGYSVVKPKMISYNPARANVGSFGINMSKHCVAVTSAYPVFSIKEKYKSKFIPEYVYLQITKNKFVQEQIKERAYGTIRQSLNQKEFLKIQIPNNDLTSQQELVEKIKKTYYEYSMLKKKLDTLQL